MRFSLACALQCICAVGGLWQAAQLLVHGDSRLARQTCRCWPSPSSVVSWSLCYRLAAAISHSQAPAGHPDFHAHSGESAVIEPQLVLGLRKRVLQVSLQPCSGCIFAGVKSCVALTFVASLNEL